METINGDTLEAHDIQAEKMGDFLFFEGPLLSLFKESDGQLYLYKWCDSDEYVNRWLVVNVSQEKLFFFFKGIMSLRNIITTSKETYFIEIDNNLLVLNKTSCIPGRIPNIYLPKRNSYFIEEHYSEYALEYYDTLQLIYELELKEEEEEKEREIEFQIFKLKLENNLRIKQAVSSLKEINKPYYSCFNILLNDSKEKIESQLKIKLFIKEGLPVYVEILFQSKINSKFENLYEYILPRYEESGKSKLEYIKYLGDNLTPLINKLEFNILKQASSKSIYIGDVYIKNAAAILRHNLFQLLVHYSTKKNREDEIFSKKRRKRVSLSRKIVIKEMNESFNKNDLVRIVGFIFFKKIRNKTITFSQKGEMKIEEGI